MTPATPSSQVLYTARPALWARILLIVVGTAIVLMVGSGALALLLSDGGPSSWGWAALGISLPFLLLIAVRPARAAIDAHQRWLRGEFGRG